MSAELATKLATATTAATNKITAMVMTFGSLDALLARDPAVRGGSGGPMGGVSPGAGAQGTNDGPLGVGPMPVLSEPLGSSISDHGSAGLARCRDRALPTVVHRKATRSVRCPQICCWPTHSAPHPQPDGMTSSKKSARRKPARRRRQQAAAAAQGPSARRASGRHPLPRRFPSRRIHRCGVHQVRSSSVDGPDGSSSGVGWRRTGRGDRLASQEACGSGSRLVAYSADSLPAHRLLTRLMDRLSEHKLTDVLYVGHGRWWSLSCGDECCPLTGTPFDPSSHPLSAAAVFAGRRSRGPAGARGVCQRPVPGRAAALAGLADTLLAELEQFDDPGAAVRLLASIVEAAFPNQLFQMRGPACCWVAGDRRAHS